MIESAVTGAAMRAALCLTGAALSAADDETPPGSGWRGTTIAVGIWLSPFVVIALALRR